MASGDYEQVVLEQEQAERKAREEASFVERANGLESQLQSEESAAIIDAVKEKEKPVPPTSYAYGVTNICGDGSRVFFADYDRIELMRLIAELKSLIEKFPKCFTNFLILESTEGCSVIVDGLTVGYYHVVSFAKLPYQKLCEVLEATSVDPLFYRMLKGTSFRSNTLRVSPKYRIADDAKVREAPKVLCWYPAYEILRPRFPVSSPHLKLYKELLNAPDVFTWKNIDDKDKFIEVDKYDTK